MTHPFHQNKILSNPRTSKTRYHTQSRQKKKKKAAPPASSSPHRSPRAWLHHLDLSTSTPSPSLHPTSPALTPPPSTRKTTWSTQTRWRNATRGKWSIRMGIGWGLGALTSTSYIEWIRPYLLIRPRRQPRMPRRHRSNRPSQRRKGRRRTNKLRVSTKWSRCSSGRMTRVTMRSCLSRSALHQEKPTSSV